VATQIEELYITLDAKTDGFEKAVGASTAKGSGYLAKLGGSFKDLVTGPLGATAILASVVVAYDKVTGAADAVAAAQTKLAGTAKLTGVPLAALQSVAESTADKFKLNIGTASDLSTELFKLSTKAGDVGKTTPALQGFLDIGAGRGLSAAETLKAVQQSILGIDEGTDKLFGKNPSVLYEEYARKIGTTAGKLDDQQKAQALLNAALEDGVKVQGSYEARLDTVAGKQEQAALAAEKAFAQIGAAIAPVRAVVYELFAATVPYLVEGFARFFSLVAAGFNGTAAGAAGWGAIVTGVMGAIVDKAGPLLKVFGVDANGLAGRLKATSAELEATSQRLEGAATENVARAFSGAAVEVKKTEVDLTKLKLSATAAGKAADDGGKKAESAAKKAAKAAREAADEYEKIQWQFAETLAKTTTSLVDDLLIELDKFEHDAAEKLKNGQLKPDDVATLRAIREAGLVTQVIVEEVAKSLEKAEEAATAEDLAAAYAGLEAASARVTKEIERQGAGTENGKRLTGELATIASARAGLEERIAAGVLVTVDNLNQADAVLAASVARSERQYDAVLAIGGEVLGIAAAWGLVSQNSASNLGHILAIASELPGMVRNLEKINSEGGSGWEKLGAAIPVIGGLVDFIGNAAFNAQTKNRPAVREEKERQEENNRRLAELNRTLGDLRGSSVSGSSLGSARTALEGLTPSVLREQITYLAKNFKDGLATAVDDKFLAGLGTTFEELKKVAEGLGLSFNGTVGDLLALRDALLSIDLKAFGDTFAGSLEALRLEFDLFDIEDPLERIKRLVAVMGDEDTGAPAIAKIFEGLDLATSGGRASATARIQDFFKKIREGTLTLEDLGGLSLDEFIASLKELEAGLDEIPLSADEARNSLAGFESQLSSLAATLDLLDIEDPVAQLAALGEQLETLPDSVQEVLNGLDLSTEAGVREANERVKALARDSGAAARLGISQAELTAQLQSLDRYIDAAIAGFDKAASGGGASSGASAGGGAVRLGAAGASAEFTASQLVNADSLLQRIADATAQTAALMERLVTGPQSAPLFPPVVGDGRLAAASGGGTVVYLAVPVNFYGPVSAGGDADAFGAGIGGGVARSVSETLGRNAGIQRQAAGAAALN